jgi:hypothetical protein
LLINLQPYARPMRIEARFGNERRKVGTAQDSAEKLRAMRESLRRIAEMVAAGLFSLRDEAQWIFQMEYEFAKDWKEFTEKPNCGGIEADLQQLAAAFERADGCVVLTEEDLAAVYERLDAACSFRQQVTPA